MSSRGRGFSSRGSSYRGRGNSDWNSSSGRGGYSSSRGRFNKYSTPSYDSRNQYSTDSGRYSSRGGGRGDHSNSYKRPRDSYSSREDHRSSTDSGRKRMRNDSYQGSGAGSQRYSYGGSSASGYEENKRSASGMYEDKRVNDRPSSYHRQDERHSASRSYTSQTSGRQNEISSGPRYQSRGRASSQSGSYRGRVSRGSSRGFQRLGPRADAIPSRKRTLNTIDYRRKLIGTRPRDYVQRARITTKMRRSSGTSRLSGSKKETSTASMKDKMAKAINAEFSDDDDEEDNKSNWDDDEKPLDHDEDEDEPTEEKKPKEEKRKKEMEEIEKEQSDDEEVKDEEIERNEEEEEEEVELKDEIIDEEDRDKEDVKSIEATRSGSEELPCKRNGQRFIKLNCPHCVHRSVTFKEYSLHLYSGRHNAAMRRVAARRKAELARMRVVQRQEQKRIEAKDESRGTLPSRTLFCPICKLNYRSLKAMHQLSESHRQIKRFLAPFCRICRIPFRSPMLYETHICSLDHIKRKSLIHEEKRTEMTRNGRNDESSGAEEDDKEVNLENFMTLDSVGDVDEEEEIAEKKKKEASEAECAATESADKKAKTKQMIKVGAEFIKRIEVNFCDLCKAYLPINENADRAIAFHCSTRSHLRRYVRNNDDKALRRQAERIHLQSSSVTATASANASATEGTPSNGDQVSADKSISIVEGVTSNDDGKPDESQKKSSESNTKKDLADEDDEDDLGEDNVEQMWDKDINDVIKLGEVGGKSSDDEDSRYDRFRISEKKLKEKEGKKDDEKENGTTKLDAKTKTDKLEK